MTRADYDKIVQDALGMYREAKIALTEEEEAGLEVSDFGLGNLLETGIQLVVYVNTDTVCAKEIALFPRQICPEHRHPPLGDYVGKEETFRCRAGTVYIYVEGEPTPNPRGRVPRGDVAHYTAWHEIVLKPGEQYTLKPNTLHWFQAGEEGAILSEFSTPSFDDKDIFTNPNIDRLHKLCE